MLGVLASHWSALLVSLFLASISESALCPTYRFYNVDALRTATCRFGSKCYQCDASQQTLHSCPDVVSVR